MRITEIIRTSFSEPQQAQDISSRGSWGKEDPEALGRGSYAKVIQDPSDPHVVIRQEYNFTDSDKNGFLQWALAIRDHAESNPYLPRIYDIDQEYHRVKNRVLSRYTYKIERLFSGEILNTKQILALGEYNFRDYEALMEKLNGPKWRSLDDESLWDQLTKMLRIYLPDSSSGMILQPELIQANTLIKQIISELKTTNRNVVYDLFSDNIMVRMYPSLHLVITDPVGAG